jgi:hypothetical protein
LVAGGFAVHVRLSLVHKQITHSIGEAVVWKATLCPFADDVLIVTGLQPPPE